MINFQCVVGGITYRCSTCCVFWHFSICVWRASRQHLCFLNYVQASGNGLYQQEQRHIQAISSYAQMNSPAQFVFLPARCKEQVCLRLTESYMRLCVVELHLLCTNSEPHSVLVFFLYPHKFENATLACNISSISPTEFESQSLVVTRLPMEKL